MIRAVGAEWRKTLRRGMIVGGIGVMVAFSLLAVTIRFVNAEEGAPPGEGAPQARGPPIFSREELETETGPVLAFAGFSGGLMGVVSLVLFAQSVGAEYGWGTLRVMLTREPRRILFLGGKLVAMTLFVGLGILVALLVQYVAAIAFALGMNVDMGAWWTATGFLEAGSAFLRVWFTGTVWGLFGTVLALGFRSAAPAIGTGIGYALVAENLLTLAWDDGRKWLPGQLLGMFNTGVGNPVELPIAGLLLAAYAVAFVVASAILIRVRDVSS